VLILRRYAAARETKRPIRYSLGWALHVDGTPPKRIALPDSREEWAAPASRGLLVGTDNRLSTSKTTAALWSVVVAYFILALGLIATTDRDKFADLFQSFSPLYLVFLGGPFAAAVLAKARVSSGVNNGELQKSTAPAPRLADVFSDDDGNTDLVDTQYVGFNFIVAIITTVFFVRAPGFGAPPVPGFLAGLTGASAATYAGNKALITSNAPTLDRAMPGKARRGQLITLYGSNLQLPGDTATPSVTIDVQTAKVSAAKPDRVKARVPLGARIAAVGVDVVTPAGNDVSKDALLTVVDDSITVTGIDGSIKHPGDVMTVFGSGFFNAYNIDENGQPNIDENDQPRNGVAGAQVILTQASPPADTAQPQRYYFMPYAKAHNDDSNLTVQIPKDFPEGQWNVSAERDGLLSPQNNINVRVIPRPDTAA
jgi:multisubunit Na+/H+ antiporter MnhG subunit